MDNHHYKIKTRLYCPHAPLSNKTSDFCLDEKQSHYIRNVMRCHENDFIGVFNSHDGEYACQIIKINKKNVILRPVTCIKNNLLPDNLTLIFAVIKKAPLAYLIQKTTELGIGTLQPIITQFTTSHDINYERLESITIEAAEQCGLTAIPQIMPLKPLNDIVDTYKHIIFCDEKGTGIPIKACHDDKKSPIDALLIGPEGGFSQAEADFLYEKSNIQAVSLGNRIMRAETAAIASLAIIQALKP